MKIRLLLFVLIVSQLTYAQSWEWAWGNQISPSDDDQTPRIAVDGDDNVIVAGTYRDAPTLGDVQHPAPESSGRNIIVAKYSSDGDLIWSGTIAGGGGANLQHANDRLYDIAADASGNIYLSGNIGVDAVAFGVNVNNAEDRSFVAHITPDGNLGWIKTSDDNYLNDKMTLVEVGEDGYVYAGGYSGEETNIIGYSFGGVSIQDGPSGLHQVLIQIDPSGDVQWVQQITAKEVRRLISDENGTLVISSFGSSGGPDVAGHYLTKFNTNTMEEEWVRYTFNNTIGSGRSELGLHMKTDGSIVQFLTAGTSSPLDFGNGFGTDDIEGNQMGVLLQISSDGTTNGLYMMKNAFIDGYLSLDLESFAAIDDNTFYILAEQINTLNLTDGPTIDPSGGIIESIAGRDVLVLKIDGEGNVLEFASQTGKGLQMPKDIAVFSNGDAAVCGLFETASHPFFGTGHAQFGPDELITEGSEDIFIAKVSTGIEAPLSIEERAKDFSFNLYPSPAVDQITLSFLNRDNSNVFMDIYDASGRLVRAERSTLSGQVNYNLDISSLQSGVYIARIRMGEQTFGRRFVISD